MHFVTLVAKQDCKYLGIYIYVYTHILHIHYVTLHCVAYMQSVTLVNCEINVCVFVHSDADEVLYKQPKKENGFYGQSIYLQTTL